MTDISKLAGITADEIRAFREHGIHTVEKLWEAVAAEPPPPPPAEAKPTQTAPGETPPPEGGYSELLPGGVIIDPPAAAAPTQAIENLAKKIGISTGRLVALLAADPFNPTPLLDRAALRSYPFLWIALVGVIVLCLAALGLRLLLPQNTFGRYQVLLARQDLSDGQVLNAADFYESSLPVKGEYLDSLSGLEGARLAGDLGRDKPLRYAAVLRPQLQAARDLPAGAVLSGKDLSLAWSAYQPAALTALEAAIGATLKQPVQKDKPLLNTALQTPAAQTGQVAAAPAAGLPALRLLQAADLKLVQAAPQSGTFTTTDELAGGLLLEAVQPGELLRRDQVLTAAQLKNRRLVTLPLGDLPLSPLLKPGDSLSLNFYPLDPDKSKLKPVGLPQVWLAAVAADGKSITVAAPSDAIQTILPNLTGYQVLAVPVP